MGFSFVCLFVCLLLLKNKKKRSRFLFSSLTDPSLQEDRVSFFSFFLFLFFCSRSQHGEDPGPGIEPKATAATRATAVTTPDP